MVDESAGAHPGPGVDRAGNPVIDPTRNVLGLVAAAIQRQDDLRESEANHVRETASLRAHYDDMLAKAESARIDAIRAVDVGAVQRAAEVQAAQQSAIQATVATTAEAMRVSLAAALDPIQTSIADLRRAQYEAQGQKTQVVETQARGGSVGLWVGAALAGFAILVTVLVALATLLVATHAFG